MEAAFLSGIATAPLQVILDRLATFTSNKLGSFLGVDDQLKKLERTLLKIQAFVEEIEYQHLSHSNKAWQVWLQHLKSIFYDADDLLDEISLELLRLESRDSMFSQKNQVLDMVLSSFKFSIPHEINKMQKKLEDMLNEMDCPLMSKIIKVKRHDSMERPNSSSLVNALTIIGRENDKRGIVNLLFKNNALESNISVIPIVGMGGIGKTTLSQIIYNDDEVKNHFDLRMWVSVSTEFDVIRITNSIFESITGEVLNLLELDSIQVKLQEVLRGKKFLLVLDDLWNENTNNWNVLQLPFQRANYSSKIIVTTRSSVVASVVATKPAYYLQPLSDDECWALIEQRALAGRNLQDDMVVMGKKIAEKCRGLPLAAKTIGGVLRSKFEGFEWDELLKSKLWDFPNGMNEIFSALRLSYDHLPVNLKKCFTYCSIFPYNYEFEMHNMVQLWTAEGFIRPQGSKKIEDVGREWFNDLIQRSFLQFSHINHQNKRIYKMHGLIHDLAQLVSSHSGIKMEGDTLCSLPINKDVLHLSMFCQDIQPLALKRFHRYKSLRTFMLSKNGSQIIQVPYDLFLHLQRLRVLNLRHTNQSELPDSIEYLKHLRYLDASETYIEKLPETTANLFSLQTLKLWNCFKLIQLPKDMKNLTQLLHLDVDIKHQISFMPSEFGKLTNLQTLHAFIVGKERGSRVEELKNLRSLHGSICITNLENVANVKDAEGAELDNKTYLNKLELQWNNLDGENAAQILAGLRPHERLRELKIINYNGLMFPSWLHDPTFSKLESVHLLNCRYCSLLPPLGQLPALKSLYIESMDALISVDHDFCGGLEVKGFRSLESLTFNDMPKLKEWEGIHVNDMPKLRQLTIVDCPNLVNLPSLYFLASLECLDVSRCQKLQSLPEHGLPISLKALIIIECDILKERCRVGEGEDWHKIEDIPKIQIDYVEISVEGHVN